MTIIAVEQTVTDAHEPTTSYPKQRPDPLPTGSATSAGPPSAPVHAQGDTQSVTTISGPSPPATTTTALAHTPGSCPTTSPLPHSTPMPQQELQTGRPPSPLEALKTHVNWQGLYLGQTCQQLQEYGRACTAYHAVQRAEIEHLRGLVVDLSVKVAVLGADVRDRQPDNQRERLAADTHKPQGSDVERLANLEATSQALTRRVGSIEEELLKVVEVANLQEVVASQLVQEAHGIQQANRGRNMVIF